MKDEKLMWKIEKLQRMQRIYIEESIAVSLTAMVLIFGLGFIIPDVNPYVVIKWIVYVSSAYFVFAFVGNWVRRIMIWRLKSSLRKEVKAEMKKKSSRK
jgi:hypothetical protein